MQFDWSMSYLNVSNVFLQFISKLRKGENDSVQSHDQEKVNSAFFIKFLFFTK